MASNNNEAVSRRYGVWMMAAAWALLLLMAVLFFEELEQERRNPNQVLRVEGSNEQPSVRLQRNAYGHYIARGEINGAAVDFLVDTGASGVAIPQSVADRLGLRSNQGMRTETAGGVVNSYALVLDEVRLGPLVRYKVRGSIVPDMPGDEVLLGMTFLRDLELVQRNGELILRN
jgi:aspartyl protease family protein